MTIITNPSHVQIREQLYQQLTEKEGRKYSDETVKALPDVPSGHLHEAYWQSRKKSLDRFVAYLREKVVPGASILDIGCGMGWMSHYLSRLGYKVTGVDVNRAALKQAERVFGVNDHLEWMYVDVLEDRVPGAPYDIALFADTLQFFADIPEIVEKVGGLLTSHGEIHLLHISPQSRALLPYAQDKSFAYFSKLGVSEMGYFHYHHDLETLESKGFRKMISSWREKWFPNKGEPEWWYLGK